MSIWKFEFQWRTLKANVKTEMHTEASRYFKTTEGLGRILSRDLKVLKIFTAWKVSVFGVFLVRIFLHSDWMPRDILYLSIFSLNASKYGPEKLQVWTLFTEYFYLMTIETINHEAMNHWKITILWYSLYCSKNFKTLGCSGMQL